jgi:S1-C subfamily serine protease
MRHPQRWKLERALRHLLVAACLWAVTVAAQAQRISTGTGFFVTADGYFVTCQHVIASAGTIVLRNLKGQTFPARVVLADRAVDLAILKAEGRFSPLPVGASAAVRRGEAIVTMGFPNVSLQGIEPKVTDGIVNSFSGANNDARVFQISAPIQTGNSGGPVVTMHGNVVGIVSSKLDAQATARQTGDIPQNVNYAIKAQHLTALIERAAQVEPALATGLAIPLAQEKARVVDVVPALEEGIALVLVRAAAPTPAPPAAAAPAAPAIPGAPESAVTDERRERGLRLLAEYRQWQGLVNRLRMDELILSNQVNALRLAQQFEPLSRERQAEFDDAQRRLRELAERRADASRRMVAAADAFRQWQAEAPKGNL